MPDHPLVRSSAELHDALYTLGFMTEHEVAQNHYEVFLKSLLDQGRACRMNCTTRSLWLVAERLPCRQAIFLD